MEKNLVEEAVTEYFGERCPEYEPGCACCEGWKQYDTLKNALPFGNGGWLVPYKR
jgi:hypothetical protein